MVSNLLKVLRKLGQLALALCFFVGITASTTNTKIRDPRHCQIYGSIFIETRKAMADVSVFVEPNEGFADMLVFKQQQPGMADKPGHWYITENRAFADFIIYIEPQKNLSDFSIFYTKTESFAGCQ